MPKIPTVVDQDCIVIGGGIVGLTITLALRKQGRQVKVFDRGAANSGTKPSGGHLKPSWFDLPKEEYEPAIQLLDDIWGIHEQQFAIVGKDRTETVYRVDTDQVLETLVTPGKVKAIKQFGGTPVVELVNGKFISCKLLIVAAGVWVGELFPEIKVIAKQGVSFRVKGKLASPFIKEWAPYKQIVAHQQSTDEVWIGDGSTILPKNWTEERTAACKHRCLNAITPGIGPIVTKTLIGQRPYVAHEAGQPCFMKEMFKNCWVVTGAGKSGTIAAGWSARKLIDATN